MSRLALAVVLLWPAPLFAQEIEEVIVTATRKDERLQDVPISTAVLSGLTLEALGSSGADIRVLAFSVPSLNIEASNGRTFPRFYIRGYGNTDFTNFASQPVGLYYDDVVQETPILKGFPIFDTQDVEVLRGPQGTLFGRNSPAGVVKVQSAAPVIGDFSGYFSASDGTYNDAVFQGVVNVPINDKMALRFSAQEQHRDNWVYDPINHANLMGYDDFGGRVQLLVKPSEDFDALFNFHGRALDGQGILFRANIIQPGSNGSLAPNFDVTKFYGDGRQGGYFDSLGWNLHLNWHLPGITLQSITGYESILNYFTIGDIDGGYGAGFFAGQAAKSGPGFIPFGVETSAGTKNHRQWTEELRAVSNWSGPIQAQAGIFIFDENISAFSNDYDLAGATLVDTTISKQKNDAEAVFASLEYAATSQLKLRGGVRYTEDHKTFSVPFTNLAGGLPPPNSAKANAANISWDASASYAIEPNIDLYARAATGFRAPSFGAPSSGPPPLPIQVARSEENISYEAGIKSELFDRRARVNFDIFHYNVSHQQLTAVGGQTNVVQLINAQHTIGDGAELEVVGRITPDLTVNVSGSYNHTKIKDPTLAVAPCFNWGFIGGPACTELNPLNKAGLALVNGNSLPEAPKYIADLGWRYTRAVDAHSEITFYNDWSYRSSMQLFLDKEKEFTAPDLYQMGLRLAYSFADGKYEVAAFCRNCTDNVKIIYGINFDNFTGIVNDPRIVGGQVRVNF